MAEIQHPLTQKTLELHDHYAQVSVSNNIDSEDSFRVQLDDTAVLCHHDDEEKQSKVEHHDVPQFEILTLRSQPASNDSFYPMALPRIPSPKKDISALTGHNPFANGSANIRSSVPDTILTSNDALSPCDISSPRQSPVYSVKQYTSPSATGSISNISSSLQYDIDTTPNISPMILRSKKWRRNNMISPSALVDSPKHCPPPPPSPTEMHRKRLRTQRRKKSKSTKSRISCKSRRSLKSPKPQEAPHSPISQKSLKSQKSKKSLKSRTSEKLKKSRKSLTSRTSRKSRRSRTAIQGDDLLIPQHRHFITQHASSDNEVGDDCHPQIVPLNDNPTRTPLRGHSHDVHSSSNRLNMRPYRARKRPTPSPTVSPGPMSPSPMSAPPQSSGPLPTSSLSPNCPLTPCSGAFTNTTNTVDSNHFRLHHNIVAVAEPLISNMQSNPSNPLPFPVKRGPSYSPSPCPSPSGGYGQHSVPHHSDAHRLTHCRGKTYGHLESEQYRETEPLGFESDNGGSHRSGRTHQRAKTLGHVQAAQQSTAVHHGVDQRRTKRRARNSISIKVHSKFEYRDDEIGVESVNGTMYFM